MNLCTCADTKEATPGKSGLICRLARETTAALVVVFLLFTPYLSQFFRVGQHVEDVRKGRNAFWLMWQPIDFWSLLACMTGIALLAVAIREILRGGGLSRLLRFWDHVFVLALGGGVLANLWFHTQRPEGYHISQYGMETQTGWVLLFATAAYSFARPGSRLVLRCRQLCQILSPAILIVLWQLWQLPTIEPKVERPVALPSHKPAAVQAISGTPATHPVFLFIFDEWSYTRMYQDGRLLQAFHNLAKLSDVATTFHNAHSPGTHTIASIPAILRATPEKPQINWLKPGFMVNDQFVPATTYPSIFNVAGCSDYHKVMLQWGFAVNLWLEDELDVRHSYSCYPRCDGLVGSVGLHLYNAVFFWTDPWTVLAYEKLKPYALDRPVMATYRSVRDDVMRILTGQPQRTFAIIHYPLPHAPYIVNADGSYYRYDPKNRILANVEGYGRNLTYLDTLVGEYVKALKSSGRFDDCMLILTSDHSWRSDPDVPQKTDDILTHVPLIVKLPGQQQASRVDESFQTCNLGQLIAQGLRNSIKPQQIAQVQDISLPR